jgi:hypothetical protein
VGLGGRAAWATARAAETGACLNELMARLGHSSTRAALIYQRAARDNDQAIAEALGCLVREVRAPVLGVRQGVR